MKKLFYIILSLQSCLLLAQIEKWENPNFRSIKKDSTQSIVLEDAMIRETLKVSINQRAAVENKDYQIVNNLLILEKPVELKLEYYINPLANNETLYAKDSSLIVERKDETPLYEFSQGMSIPKKSPLEQLNTNGSLVRGISFGNNQGASVQSSLNLNMEGKLSENLNIKANLSDYNIPIEQNGYTQQINEFENIYLSIYNENSSLNAGFLDVVSKENYFANFNKKLTGIQLNTRLNHAQSYTDLSATASLSRGEFHRIRFKGIEGNQGPYKLRGKNNENYIIIIPRSERVYLDGILLKSGLEEDYTLNYNTGELVFTNKRLISQNFRITVEFQYTALHYNRFLVYGTLHHQRKKWSFRTSIYSENDAKNSPKSEEIGNEEKQLLSQAGNNTDLMWTSTAQESEYAENRILYRKVEQSGVAYYEYSTDATDTLYTVGFSYVGAHRGDYIQSQTSVNGRIYSYIPPSNGVPQGDYVAERQLVAPESRQVYTIDTEFQLKNGAIELNAALSQHDKNTFSSLQDKENTGYALRAKLYNLWKWKQWSIQPSIEYSFIQQNFFIIDRIKPIEFNRDFLLNSEFTQANQQQAQFSFKAQKKVFQMDYSLDFLKRKNQYEGLTHSLNLSYQPQNYELLSRILLHNNSRNDGKADFQDYQLQLNKNLSKNYLSIGTVGRIEQDSYEDGSYLNQQNNQRYYIKNSYSDSLRFAYQAELYYSRNDTLQLQRDVHTRANGAIVNMDWTPQNNHQLTANMHYRHIQNEEKISTQHIEESHVVTSVKWIGNLWKKSLRMNAEYILGSGFEPQRAFEYVEVSDGNGLYKWTDYNGNQIQELDEFELAEFQDLANYIRVYTQTIQYLKTAKNGLNLSLVWTPHAIWKSDFTQRWNLRTHYRNESSFQKLNKTVVFNPFEESDLLYRTQNLRADILFNNRKKNKVYGQYNFILNEVFRNHFLGIETLHKKIHELQWAWRFKEPLWLVSTAHWSLSSSYSQQLANKNYEFPAASIRIGLESLSLKNLKSQAFFQYQEKYNKKSLEQLFSREWGLSVEYLQDKSSLIAAFSYVINGFEGNAQTLVANQMMGGLKPGKNMVWNFNLQKKLAQFLFLDIMYEGRKNENFKTIHIGNVQVKFVF